MNTQLFLTADERKIFDSLPDTLKEGWTVENELQDSYETSRQLAMRYNLADFGMQPEMKIIAEKIANGGDITDFSLKDIPGEVQEELYFVLGARGVESLISLLMSDVNSDDAIEAIAALSTVRHKLLEINASAQYK